MGKASVILPVHNVAPYLEDCLNSALSQTLSDTEIVVVDDASVDQTPEILARYAKHYPQLRVLRCKRNKGVSVARNMAIEAASGDWLAFIDGDDWMDASRLAVLISEAERLGADWIADDQFFIREGETKSCGQLMVEEPPGARLIDAAHIVTHDPPSHLGYGLLKPVVRRSFLANSQVRYRPDLRHHGDFMFALECACNGAKLALLNEPLYWYRLRKGSLTTANTLFIIRAMLVLSKRARATARNASMGALELALAEREREIEKDLRYYQVIVPLKAKDVGGSLWAWLQDPAISAHIAGKFVDRARLRLTRRDRFEVVLLSPRGHRPKRPAAPTKSRSEVARGL